MTETPRRYTGKSVPRKEDAALLAGRATFTNDIRLPGMLHLAVLRSPHAHARITKVDTSAARELPGGVTAFSGEDLAEEWTIGIPCGWLVTEDINVPDHWPLARDEVNHVGEGVSSSDPGETPSSGGSSSSRSCSFSAGPSSTATPRDGVCSTRYTSA